MNSYQYNIFVLGYFIVAPYSDTLENVSALHGVNDMIMV